MFTLFPGLLTFSFFAPTLLRLAAGGVILFAAYRIWQRHRHLPPALFWGNFTFHIVIGLMLVAGYYTQLAALLGAVGSGVGIFPPRFAKHVIVFSRGTLFLLTIICLSLLLTGAGALAIDLPL